MSKLDEIKDKANAGISEIDDLRALLPVVEAAVALREFSNRLSSWGMTPAQEMERVHLFQDYEDAIDALMSTEDE